MARTSKHSTHCTGFIPVTADSVFVLSNNNMTAACRTQTPQKEYQHLFSVAAQAKGIFFVRTKIDKNDGKGWCYAAVGFANDGQLDNQSLGDDLNSIGLWDDGSIFYNAADVKSLGRVWNTDDMIDQVLDLDNRKYWARVNLQGWNGAEIAEEDPWNNVGGVDISKMIIGSIRFVTAAFYVDDSFANKLTANFIDGLSPFFAWNR
jgi:hypothetical protein